jgi:hypothetical protein
MICTPHPISLGDKIERNGMGGTCNTYGGEERCIQGHAGKTLGKRPLGRPRHRWVDNIKMDLQEVGCRCMDWNDVDQDGDRWWAVVDAVMKFRVP